MEEIRRRLLALRRKVAAAMALGGAALLLALDTIARGREVVVSRGELVEIGGSFRIPDVLRKGGARLREVGTTNRTRLADYRMALTPDSALILKVHPSNFRSMPWQWMHRGGCGLQQMMGCPSSMTSPGKPTMRRTLICTSIILWR